MKERGEKRYVRKIQRSPPRGKLKDGDLAYCRSVGITDRDIIEIITPCAQYVLNMLNNAIDTEIDFPGKDAKLRAQ